MSLADQAVTELESTEQFFNRSTRSLTEEHSGVKPAPDVMTAAQQVAHAAQMIDWFIEGAFRPEGFDTALAGSAVFLAGPRLQYLAPFWSVILADHGVAIALHLALGRWRRSVPPRGGARSGR